MPELAPLSPLSPNVVDVTPQVLNDEGCEEYLPTTITDVDPELKIPKMASLVIMIATNAFLQISFFIIVSSSNKYAIHLGGTSTFSGIVIGIPTVISGLALFPMSKLDRGSYKIPLHVSCCASILGNVLYALAYHANYLYLVLIGRIISGFGFMFLMYCKRYCSDPRIVGVRRRTTLASWLIIGQGLGMSLGPFAGGLLYKIGFQNSIFNGFTSPAWTMAAIWCIFWIFIVPYYEDIPLDQRSFNLLVVPAVANYDNQPIEPPYKMNHQQWGVMICMCWFAMTCFFILGAWISNLPVFGAATPQLHWSPFATGNFIALGGIAIFPFLMLNLIFARRIEDRKILAIGSGLGFSALLVFLSLLKTRKLSYGSIYMCWWAVALGFSLASTVTISTLSKQLPPSWNGRTSLTIQYCNFAGGVTGSVWGGSGVRVGMLNYIGLQIILVGIGAVLFIIFWRDLKTKMG